MLLFIVVVPYPVVIVVAGGRLTVVYSLSSKFFDVVWLDWLAVLFVVVEWVGCRDVEEARSRTPLRSSNGVVPLDVHRERCSGTRRRRRVPINAR